MDESIFDDSILCEDRDSFVQPPTRSLRSFAIRKRKRKVSISQDQDNVSVYSLDLDATNELEPEVKKKKSLSRVTSLSSVFSSPRSLSKKMSRVGSAIHKSISSARLPSPAGMARTPSRASLARSASTVFGEGQKEAAATTSSSSSSGRVSPGSVSLPDSNCNPSPIRRSTISLSRKASTSSLTPYRPPVPTPGKNRPTRFWSQVYVDSCHKLSRQEIKLQEAIFEIYNGEEDLVEDLKLVRKTYADSLIHLNILTPDEESLVFGHLNQLVPLHTALHAGLKKIQSKDGIWVEIGDVVAAWVNTLLEPYVAYCSNMQNAKIFLDKKRDEDKAFSDFLQRCLESPFSRKLDLWSFLDVPRSRLVKYPLLIRQVLKFTDEPDDKATLSRCLVQLESVVAAVDQAMAEAKCRASVANMEFLDEEIPEVVTAAREEILAGMLRNSRGTKVSVHLLDTVLVVGRTVSRAGVGKILQVYKDPIPLQLLDCQDMADGEGGKQGSFHRAFSSSASTNRNAFKVSWKLSDGESATEGTTQPWRTHTLLAPDEHIKRQWVSTINKAIENVGNNKNATVHENGNNVKTETDSGGLKVSPKAKTPPVISRVMKSGRARSSPCLKSMRNISSPMMVKREGTPVSRMGMFKKNASSGSRSSLARSSPMIKSSLSQSAMERLKSGGVKKLRTSKSRLRQDENHHRGAIVMDGSIVMTAKNKNNTVVKRTRNTEKKSRMLTSVDNNRQRTKSWSHLVMSPDQPRYLTRSTAKISKSLSDLLQA